MMQTTHEDTCSIYNEPATKPVPLPKRCECSDRACPAHMGQHCDSAYQITATRIDAERWAGDKAARVRFCEACYEDAMESGLFG